MNVIDKIKEVPVKKMIIGVFTIIAILSIGHAVIYTAMKVSNKINTMQMNYNSGI